MRWTQLTKVDTNIYKGIAILLIVLHNFMQLFPTPKEMEFEFKSGLFEIFLASLLQPQNFFQTTLSYFGHFGVQIFIFLSAYGLTKSFLYQKPKYGPYIWKRFATIYPAFLLAIVMFSTVRGRANYGFLGPLNYFYENLDSFLLKISLLSNFVPGQIFNLVAPWWFISFIFQFYLVFPLLFKAYTRSGNLLLILVSLASVGVCFATGGKIADVNLYGTIIGHLPELCLGLYLAKSDEQDLRLSVFIIPFAIIIYVLGNVYEPFWYLTHFSFLVLLLAFLQYVVPALCKSQFFQTIFIFLGTISMALFLVNGFVRWRFYKWSAELDIWYISLGLCLVSLSVSILAALILYYIEKTLRSMYAFIRGRLAGKG
jgi:peptidoglycan/LPS O-acetylase OafA/YrhL